MRHRKAKKQLGRTSSHRSALYNNLLRGLVEHGRIQTTERKARDLVSIADKTMSKATALGEALLKKPAELDVPTKAKLIHAMRLVKQSLKGRDATQRLFTEWAPRYIGRPGGYTRMFKLGFRRGDSAPMALVEFVPAELPAALKKSTEGGEKSEGTKKSAKDRNAPKAEKVAKTAAASAPAAKAPSKKTAEKTTAKSAEAKTKAPAPAKKKAPQPTKES